MHRPTLVSKMVELRHPDVGSVDPVWDEWERRGRVPEDDEDWGWLPAYTTSVFKRL